MNPNTIELLLLAIQARELRARAWVVGHGGDPITGVRMNAACHLLMMRGYSYMLDYEQAQKALALAANGYELANDMQARLETSGFSGALLA